MHAPLSTWHRACCTPSLRRVGAADAYGQDCLGWAGVRHAPAWGAWSTILRGAGLYTLAACMVRLAARMPGAGHLLSMDGADRMRGGGGRGRAEFDNITAALNQSGVAGAVVYKELLLGPQALEGGRPGQGQRQKGAAGPYSRSCRSSCQPCALRPAHASTPSCLQLRGCIRCACWVHPAAHPSVGAQGQTATRRCAQPPGHGNTSAGLHSEQRTLLDLLVLSWAARFVGHPYSTISALLEQLRLTRGLGPTACVNVSDPSALEASNRLFDRHLRYVQPGAVQGAADCR